MVPYFFYFFVGRDGPASITVSTPRSKRPARTATRPARKARFVRISGADPGVSVRLSACWRSPLLGAWGCRLAGARRYSVR